MQNFAFVGQEINSLDCGYFCGYVLHKRRETGGFGFELSQQHLYSVRDLHRIDETPFFMPHQLKDKKRAPTRSGPGLQLNYMMKYLRWLGITDMRPRALNEFDKDEIRILLRQTLPTPATQIFITIWRNSHWILLMDRDPATNTYYKYDPSWLEAINGKRTSEDELVDFLGKKNNGIGFLLHTTDYYPIRTEVRIPQQHPQKHRVAAGESLSLIAGIYWGGDVLLWPCIWDANKNAVPFPRQLTIGIELNIPDISDLSE
ncbi:MAG: hypothetical protein KDB79_05605, partial [Acidobacteria bacterium]|nr:hypothetical protein [Acidobacteriota bacterium]